MRKLFIFCILSTLLVIARTAPAKGETQFYGRVVEAESGSGIQNLEVRLMPPSSSQQSVRLTRTDQKGYFKFSRLTQGRYVLEVSQGVYLLYRNVVDTGTKQPFIIRLRKKS
jgi:hypothetical protein